MSRKQTSLADQRAPNQEEGQSLLETAFAMPLLLALAFNIINFAYMWILLLTLSAAPRMGAQFASQGGAAGTASAVPVASAISNLVYDNVTNTIRGATSSNTAVQVCTKAVGVNSATGAALCTQFGPSYGFPSPAVDPEAPVFVLHRVDVEYPVTPIIPGAAFSIVWPSGLRFHRQASMRCLY
jgi:Flp pilus assembly protein TadG